MKNLFVGIFILFIVQRCVNKKSSESHAVVGGVIPIENSVVIKDISYGVFSRNKLNVFLPKNRTNKTKAILLIPGGGWTGGDKRNFDAQATIFADSSIAAFTMNYRFVSLNDTVTYVDLLDDVETAIQFLKSKAEAYVFDANEICLFGHSAGGHLALLYTYRNNESKIVNNVVSIAGPTDLTDSTLVDTKQDKRLLVALTGDGSIEKAKDASPLLHANHITTLLYQGQQDAIVPFLQSETLFNKIKSKNPRNRYVLLAQEGHGINYDNWKRVVGETVMLIRE